MNRSLTGRIKIETRISMEELSHPSRVIWTATGVTYGLSPKDIKVGLRVFYCTAALQTLIDTGRQGVLPEFPDSVYVSGTITRIFGDKDSPLMEITFDKNVGHYAVSTICGVQQYAKFCVAQETHWKAI